LLETNMCRRLCLLSVNLLLDKIAKLWYRKRKDNETEMNVFVCICSLSVFTPLNMELLVMKEQSISNKHNL